MCELHIFSTQLPYELDVVIAGDAHRGTSFDHAHDQLEHLRYFGTAIYQIAQKDGFAPFQWDCLHHLSIDGIAKLSQQHHQFVVAAMYVADDVERSVIGLAVIPDWLALYRDIRNLRFRPEY